MEEKNPIQVADKLFAVIETLAELGSCGLVHLSKEVSIHKTTVHRILNSLIYMGYVKQDGETLQYSLTHKILGLSNQILHKFDFVELARPFLKQLVNTTNETVHLVQMEGAHALYIDKVESYTNTIRLVSKVGVLIPLYCSGVGKALLAELPDDEIKEIWEHSDIQQLTPHTITDFSNFMEQINLIRSRGYALDNEEHELGVRCIATSICDHYGNPTYAISISAPLGRMDDERIKELSVFILGKKEELSNELSTT
ncbi:MAG: IclR family transcriptional regulator [Eubacteriales bacterium]